MRFKHFKFDIFGFMENNNLFQEPFRTLTKYFPEQDYIDPSNPPNTQHTSTWESEYFEQTPSRFIQLRRHFQVICQNYIDTETGELRQPFNRQIG